MAGFVYRPTYRDKKTGAKKQSSTWWIGYSVGGQKVRESAKTKRKREAEALLYRRLVERVPGAPLPTALGRVTFEDLCELIRADYEQNGRRSANRLEISLSHLSGFFGGWGVPAIDETAVGRYVAGRLKGAAPATINRELSALKRMLRLGFRQRLVGRVPDVARLRENNARTGFFELDDLRRLLREIDPCLSPLMQAAYITGWRKSELLSREWKHVDFDKGWFRLERGETKSGEGRMFPFTDGLARVLRDQRATRDRLGFTVANVFFRYAGRRRGQPIRSIDKEFRRACEAAGLPELLFHDFRRTAIRNLVRAGVPETTAMQLSGHETRSVFDRYTIVDERSLKAAAETIRKHIAVTVESRSREGERA